MVNNQQQQQRGAPPPHQMHNEEDGDQEEYEVDDMDDIDPEELMAAAKQYGLSPDQIRQLQQQLQSQGYGDEDDEGEDYG